MEVKVGGGEVCSFDDRKSSEGCVLKLKSYRLEPEGQSGGGRTTLWRGQDTRTSQPTRCRIINFGGGVEEERQKMYRRRAQKLASLHHRGLTPLLDVGEIEEDWASEHQGIDSGAFYFISRRRVDEVVVADMIDDLEWGGFSTVLSELLEAMAFAHSRGAIDGHLRPTSVAFEAGVHGPSSVEIREFGLIPYEEWSNGGRDGTGFEAPEVRAGVVWDIGPHSDLYSLGMMAFWWLYGRLHRTGASLPGRRQQQHFVPTGLADWIGRCLKTNTRHRFSRASEALEALEMTDRGACVSSIRQSPMPAQWRTSNHWQRGRTSSEVDGSWWWRYPVLYRFREPPMVGRQNARDQLWQALYEVERSKQARAVVINGTTGLGGHRMASWLERRAQEVGAAQVLRATHSPVSRATDGLGPMIGRFLGCSRLGGEAFRQGLRDCFEHRRLQTGGLEFSEWVELIGISEESADSEVEKVATVKESCLALRYILEQLAADGPLIVRIDDAHWASETLDWLAEVLESPAGFPVLFVVVARGKELAERPVERVQIDQLTDENLAESLQLDPLEQNEVVQLLSTMAPLEEELVYELAQRTAGSPLFAIQLLRYWVECEVLQPSKERSGRLELIAAADAEIPEDVVEVWTRELEHFGERFGPEASDEVIFALEVAAALGMEISFDEWSEVCDRLDIEIPGLMVRGLFATRIASESYEEGAFKFEHGLVREVLKHRSRSVGRHQEIHDVCVQTLVERGDDGEWTWPGRMGIHLFEAGRYEEALEHLIEGSTRLGVHDDSRRALTLLARYHEACDELGLAEDDGRRVRGWLSQAWAHDALGDVEAARQLAHHVHRRLRPEDEEEHLGRLLWLESGLAFVGGRLEEANQFLERARRHYQEIGDSEGLARTQLRCGSLARERGRFEQARRAYGAARDLFEELGDSTGETIAVQGDATVLTMLKRFEESESRLLGLVEDFDGIGPTIQGDVYNGLGEVYRAQGQWDRAEDAYRTAMELWTPTRQPLTLMVRINLAMTLVGRGDYLQAEKPLQEAKAYLAGRELIRQEIYVRAVEMPCLAARQRWTRWCENAGMVEAYVRGNEIVSQDFESMFKTSLRLAEGAAPDRIVDWARELLDTQRTESRASSEAPVAPGDR